MGRIRKTHDAAFKARVALEAVKVEKPISQLANEYGVYPNQIGQWKKKLLKDLPAIFSGSQKGEDKGGEALAAELYRQIGQLKVELDWLKKNPRFSVVEKRGCVEPGNSAIPVYRLPVPSACVRTITQTGHGRQGSVSFWGYRKPVIITGREIRAV